MLSGKQLSYYALNAAVIRCIRLSMVGNKSGRHSASKGLHELGWAVFDLFSMGVVGICVCGIFQSFRSAEPRVHHSQFY